MTSTEIDAEERTNAILKTRSLARALILKGLNVFPVRLSGEPYVDKEGEDQTATGKEPRKLGWQRENATTLDDVNSFFRIPSNVGIACGECKAGRIVVVDVDGIDGMNWIEQYGILPPTLEAATGRDGGVANPHRHHFYLWPEDVEMPTSMSLKYKDENGKKHAAHIDIKGQGGYVVGAGSMHQNGVAYKWMREAAPIEAPSWLVQLITQHRKKVEVEAKQVRVISDDEVERQRMAAWGASALQHIADDLRDSPDGSKHNDLFAAACKAGELIGHAVSHSDADSTLVEVVKGWGDRVKDIRAAYSTIDKGLKKGMENPRYPIDRELPSRAQFKFTGEVTEDIVAQLIASVSYDEDAPIVVANTKKNVNEIDSTAVEIVDESQQERRARLVHGIRKEVEYQQEPMEMVAEIGEECRQMVDYASNSLIPQPNYGMLNLISTAQGWCARRVITRQGMIVSGIQIGVGASGTGKSAALGAFKKLGLTPKQIIPANFPSVQALRKAMSDATLGCGHGVTFFHPELGKILSGLVSENVSSFRAEVTDDILSCTPMHSTGSHEFQMSVKDGGGASVTLEAPHLSIYGTTTPSALRKMLIGESAEDGVLGRCLILPGIDGADPMNEGVFVKPMPPAVERLLERARAAHFAWFQPTNESFKTMSPASAGQLFPYQPIVPNYDKDAIAALEASRIEYGFRALEAGEGPHRTVLRRCQEQIEKICVCFAVLQSPDHPVVTMQCVKAAIAVVERSAAFIVKLQSRAVGDTELQSTPHGRCVRAIMRFLSQNPGWHTSTDVTRACRAHAREIRQKVLIELTDQGSIEYGERENGSRRMTQLWRWKAD